MLTVEEQKRLTSVGPGTPMGELLRRYWYPVATTMELRDNPVKAVLLLGERLTLFQDRQGRLGLIAGSCAHRGTNLKDGIPEEEGLRCPYHGWMYDTTGQCIEQPAEPPESTFKTRVKLTSYPVEELGGLIWAYLGPQPAPLLPRWSLFVYDNVFRHIGTTVIPCNWLQCQENSVDTVHTEYLHGNFGVYVMERLGNSDPVALNRFQRFKDHPHLKIDFKQTRHGIQKLRLTEGQSEDAGSWRIGHPMVFPNYVLIGNPGSKEFQIRVPMDDTHTWHLTYQVYFPGPGVEAPKQDPVPSFEVPIRALPDFVLGHDMLAWSAQGEIMDRSLEKLGESDQGVIMLRRLLDEQIKIVEDEGDPMNTFRDPAQNRMIELEMEEYGPLRRYQRGYLQHNNAGPLNSTIDQLDEFLEKTAEAWAGQTSENENISPYQLGE